ncbi:Outer membrane protein TolC [Pseudarcicella hirudinis]|uniref:Outer membrane protein TolC n=1 Tax=Pseudarcicella hirudinis TaxID=1079859 RepID=A0A1I5MRI1_9BACT|nr:TolC family protein [Pseudarcicella hirudinis]SFP12139.1 Outer membrane protein TolC [Pseudarcicella hirudinis]
MIKLFRNVSCCICLALAGMAANAQSGQFTLQECYAFARENYPLIRKLNLISKSSAYSLENASKLYLPQLNVTAQASYQSQTISFPDIFQGAPGISLPNISKDQYKIQAEITQAIYDGGNVNNQIASVKASEAIQQQNIEVALYAVNERINQIYFSVLLMDEQLKQNDIRKSNLQNSIDKIAGALRYGTAFRSNLDELKAEVINADMSETEFRSNRSAYLQMLGALIGKTTTDSTKLMMPSSGIVNTDINRPELKLYGLQKELYKVEEKKLRTEYTPKLNAFFQGAYGRPTLNIINNQFGPWYIVGARMNWNLGSLYTLKNNRQNLEISRQSIDIDQETFLLNTNLTIRQEQGDISKYQTLIRQDQKVIELRASVKKASEAQLENGVITTHDFINQLNAENLARQTLILHSIQLLQAQYKLSHTTGNP